VALIAVLASAGIGFGVIAADRFAMAGRFFAPADVATAASAIMIATASIQAVQGFDALTEPRLGTDGVDALLGVGLLAAGIVAAIGLLDSRPFGRLVSGPWGRAGLATRLAIAAVLLELGAWLVLVGLTDNFGIGFGAAADPRSAYGIAAFVSAALLLRPAGRYLPPPAWAATVALAPLAVVVAVAAGQFDAIRAVLALPDGGLRFGSIDSIALYAHFAAVGLLVGGVVLAIAQALGVTGRLSRSRTG
jgi:hypothetical protein